jgi:hypothetical protein
MPADFPFLLSVPPEPQPAGWCCLYSESVFPTQLADSHANHLWLRLHRLTQKCAL